MGLLLIILGLLPFAFGRLMNFYVLAYPDRVPPYFAITLLALLLWGGISFLARRRLGTRRVVASLNAAALATLLLLTIQMLGFHSFWTNAVGLWTQLFFLPLLNVSFLLTTWSHSMLPAFYAAFILMFAASLLGCKTAESHLPERQAVHSHSIPRGPK